MTQLVAISLLIGVCAQSEEIPPRMQRYLRESFLDRREEIQRLEHQIKKSPPSQRRGLAEKLRQLRDANPLPPCRRSMPMPPTIGNYGTLPEVAALGGRPAETSGKIESILGPHDLLFSVAFATDGIIPTANEGFRRAPPQWHHKLVWLSGVETENLTNDKLQPEVFEATKINVRDGQQYMVLEAVDRKLAAEMWPAFFAEQWAKAEAASKEKTGKNTERLPNDESSDVRARRARI